MKTVITNEKIYFKHLCYDVVIPKQDQINYIFHDYIKNNMPLALEIKAKNIFIESRLGIVGNVLYWCQLFTSGLFFKIPVYSQSHFNNSPTIIYTKKKINSFLQELQQNCYHVENEINILNDISSRPFPKNLTPGTIEWKNDKFKLMIVAYLIFEFLFVWVFFRDKITSVDIIFFILFSIFILLVCYGIFKALSKIKIKK